MIARKLLTRYPESTVSMDHGTLRPLHRQFTAPSGYNGPPRVDSKYDKVEVLLLQWKADDLGVHTEIQKLDRLLRSHYNFTTYMRQIPSEGADDYLTNAIIEFRRGKGPRDLLIVYYGGHAAGSTWVANRMPNSPTLKWLGVQGLLLEHSINVLLILDCCNASHAARGSSVGDNWFLGATAKESLATGVSWKSFTSALIRVLERRAALHKENGQPFTVLSIHGHLLLHDRDLVVTPVIAMLTDHECEATDLTPLPSSPLPSLSLLQLQSFPTDPLSPRPLGPPLPKHKVKEENVYARLRRYDTVFLVDDSDSMEGPHWSTTAKVLAKIATIAVIYDKDGVDVRFFNNYLEGKERSNLNSSEKVMRLFRKVTPDGSTPTADILEEELNQYLAKFRERRDRKMLNLIVLTDGEPDDAQAVEEVIVKYANELKELRAPPLQVGVQFVQIGRDEAASKFLRSLDDDLVNKRGLDRDVSFFLHGSD